MEETKLYFHNRAIQLLCDNFIFFKKDGVTPMVDQDGNEWGALARFQSWSKTCGSGVVFDSVYVYKDFRKMGLYSKWLKSREMNYMITSPGCALEEYFKKVLTRQQDIWVLAATFTLTKEYKAIEAFYGDRRASRSGQYLMNHIDEGLFVLNYFGATDLAKRAYCLHPLVQKDEDLSKNFESLVEFDPKVVALAMEYRSVANEYLAHRKLKDSKNIRLSPLQDVTDMLKADKVQNYKDFLLYHKGTHKQSEQLDFYFQNWLKKLSISLDEFNFIKERMTV